jgi:hypothetical protein
MARRLLASLLLVCASSVTAVAQNLPDSEKIIVSPDGLRQVEVTTNHELKISCTAGNCAGGGGGGGTPDQSITQTLAAAPGSSVSLSTVGFSTVSITLRGNNPGNEWKCELSSDGGSTWTIPPANYGGVPTSWELCNAGSFIADLVVPVAGYSLIKFTNVGGANTMAVTLYGTSAPNSLTVNAEAKLVSPFDVAYDARQIRALTSGIDSVTVSGTITASGPLTDTQLRATPVPVSGTVTTTGLTDTQLRASAVPVSGPLTDTQLRASSVPVSGPLTDTQLRASAVPISGTVTASGPLTDTQLRATPVPVSGTITASGPLTDTQLRATPVPVSGTVTTSPPSNASTNVAQLAGTATSVNSGTKDAGTLRVVLATDQPALTNKLLVTPDSVALPANQSVNVNQYGGANTTLGQKPGATSMPVVLASDSVPAQDRISTGTVTALNGVVTILPYGSGCITITILGTWNGMLTFFGLDASANLTSLYGVNLSTGAIENSTTANGAWVVPTAGWSNVGVIGSPWTSGTANVALGVGPGSNVVMLARALPTGSNTIGRVTSPTNATLGSAAPTVADLMAGADAQGLARSLLTTNAGVLLVQQVPVSAFPLPPCNPVRRVNCSK